ncbi:ATP synthase F(0) complex subunit e, mitochondrial-like [Clavelina lepadiformis]|uniref:ATP synthase F(0) complex subunit e, mitochondrial n=1 Tax=Clavelina lepadiformis TaxID=159417 RepID=A0ABP0F7C3_CLALP
MATPVKVSPLIKTARYALLGLGIMYGYKHNETLKVRRAKERVIEIEAKDEYLRQKKEADDKARIEFERDSILFQKTPPKE